jgi:hypothetical protein
VGQLQQHLEDDQYSADEDDSSSMPFANQDSLQSGCSYLEPVLQGKPEQCSMMKWHGSHGNASSALRVV